MHTDNSGKPNLLTRHRQLSMVVQMNDPQDFIGGGLEFETEEDPLELSQGTVVTFNSGLKHRAKPVKIGTRHVMVCWFFPVDCAYYEEREKGAFTDAHEQNQTVIELVKQALRNG